MGEELGPWSSDLDQWTQQYEAEQRAGEVATGEPWRRCYSPFPSQRLFHEAPERFKGFSGPVGSGKSRALAGEVIRLAYGNPGLPGVLAAPTYRMLEDVTRQAVMEALEEGNIPHVPRKWDILLTEPQSVIRLRSMDKPTRLVGSNLAWFAVDELTYCKEDAWKRLEARLRHPKAQALEGCAVWTPKGFDWVHGRFLSDSRVDGYSAIIAAPGENTALPPDFYDRLKASYDDKFYQQEVLGKYLSIFAGQAYYAFDRAYNLRAAQFDPRHPICWAMDFNVNPMASVLCQIIGGSVYVLEEIVLPNSNTPESCRVFRERVQRYLDILQGDHYGVVPLQLKVYGDAAGNQRKTSADRTDWKIVQDFLSKEPALQPMFLGGISNPTVKGRVNAMNALLCNAGGERRLVVDPSCRELTADLEQVAWKTDTAGNSISELDKSNPKRTHVSDALGYLVEKEFGLRATSGPRSEYLGV